MVCKECGAALMDTDQFCPKCGTKVIKEKRCPDCGAVLREGTRFCHKCGRLVENGGRQKAAEEMEDIPIDAMEQNILSETAAEIKAGRGGDRESRRTAPAERRPERSPAPQKSKAEHAPASKSTVSGTAPKKAAEQAPSKSTASKSASERTASSKSASSKNVSERAASAKNAPSKGASGRSTSAKSAPERSLASGKAAPGKRPAPPSSERRSSIPEPPRRKRIDYREDDWEDEDWEDDEDWDEDEDDEEGIDFITIMTVVVGCVLLIVVALLGYRLYRQYAPRDYEEEAVQEDDVPADEDDGEEEKPQETDGSGEQSIADGDENGTYQIIVTGREVNVRNQPSTSGTEILGKVREGDVLPCYGTTEDGQWYEIRLENGTPGYVFHEYVAAEENTSVDAEYLEEQYIQE